jgi:hypothetical protein
MTLGKIIGAAAFSISLCVLGALLFFAQEKMPGTVLGFGLVAVLSAARLSEDFIDRSPHEIKKHLP